MWDGKVSQVQGESREKYEVRWIKENSSRINNRILG